MSDCVQRRGVANSLLELHHGHSSSGNLKFINDRVRCSLKKQNPDVIEVPCVLPPCSLFFSDFRPGSKTQWTDLRASATVVSHLNRSWPPTAFPPPTQLADLTIELHPNVHAGCRAFLTRPLMSVKVDIVDMPLVEDPI
ncbi:unnamed protein product [Somion occarium]|uniref:Ribosomal protein/NADH dehydrogenase domain-containing protein n=1 Tax=Somion occarium TaxID=3059160 RepID=A0ABP1E5B8_9APHY